ncbi:MAG: hypothetical protein LQ340_008102, partial [Diploschistes diacapsis]
STLVRTRAIDEGAAGMGCLGMQMVPVRREGGVVSVGDQLVVVSRGEHLYIRQ